MGEAWPWAGRGRGFEGTLRFLEETARPCRWREMPRAALALGSRPAGHPSLQPQISVGSGTARRAVLKEESSRQDFETGIRAVFSSSERLPAALPAALLRKEEAVTEEGVGSEWRGAPAPRGPPPFPPCGASHLGLRCSSRPFSHGSLSDLLEDQGKVGRCGLGRNY